METILIGVWLAGWLFATLFAAMVIGNVPNQPGDEPNFPTFAWPLTYGWAWPAAVVLWAILAPLAWLSERATARNKADPQAGEAE